MRIELTTPIAAGREEPLALLALFAMASVSRHHIAVDRDDMKVWLDSLPPDLRDEVNLALDLSEQREAVSPTGTTIVVVPRQEEEPSRGRLAVLTAVQFLARPLRIVVENGENDRNFLVSFASTPLRRRIEAAEAKGWLQFWNGGGIDGCVLWAQRIAETAPCAERVYVVCDSDGRRVGKASDKAVRVKRHLATISQSQPYPVGTVLKRRCAENYVPPNEFARWWVQKKGINTTSWKTILRNAEVNRVPTSRNDDARIWLAAKILNNHQGTELHFHMDIGYGKEKDTQDGPVDRTDADVWRSLNTFEQAALKYGLGKRNVQEFYEQVNLQHSSPDEISSILHELREVL